MKLLGFLLIVAGCEGLASPPQPRVSVLVRNAVDGCFELVTTDTPIAAALQVAGTCTTTRMSAQLFADVDLLEAVIDYGPDVDFAPSTQAPKPTVSITVDGAPSDVPIVLSDERRIGGRAYFIATFRAPKASSLDVQLTVGVNPGFQTTVPLVFSVVPPPVSLALLDCQPGIQCQLVGAVGSAHIQIYVPGDVPQTVLVHATLDGVDLPDPVPPVVTEVVQGGTVHTTATPVPAAHDGAIWAITAQLGTGVPVVQTVTIRAPTIVATLTSCPAPCTIARGTAVGLTITTPSGIRPLQAIVGTALNSVPQLVDAPVTLLQNADGTATGSIALTAPAQPGTWQIDVSVAGYRADAIVATVP